MPNYPIDPKLSAALRSSFGGGSAPAVPQQAPPPAAPPSGGSAAGPSTLQKLFAALRPDPSAYQNFADKAVNQKIK